MLRALLAALDRSGTGVLLFDSGGRIVYCNARMGDLYGTLSGLGDLVGQSLETLMRSMIAHGEFAGPAVVDDPEAWIRARLALHRGGSGGDGSEKAVEILSDGRCFEVDEMVLPDGFIIGRWDDVTERNRNAGRLQNVLDIVEDGIALWTPDDQLEMFNATFAERFAGREEKVAEGTAFSRALLALALSGRVRVVGAAEAWARGYLDDRDEPDAHLDLEYTDGKSFLLRERQSLDGSIVSILTDITDIKEKTEALQSNRAKSEFLANMSHEIRTPINAVMGMHHLLQQTVLTEQQQDYLEKANNASQALLGVINDILDFSKIEAGKIEIEAVEFQIGDVFGRLADLVVGVMRKKKIELVIAVPPDTPSKLVGDPTRLGQILLNLANNAIKFTAEGTVVVSVGEGVHLPDGRIELRFAVRDTGIGLTPEQMGKLFQAFNQADNSTMRVYGGTGLGLTISKQLVEKMGGAIGVTSESGVGSEFFFTARFGRAEDARPYVVPVDRLTGKRALVVDDLEPTRVMLTETLRRFGLEVTATDNGAEALVELTLARSPFDLVLMDWQLSGLGGPELVRRIRGNAAFGSVPVVPMVTPSGQDGAGEGTEGLDLAPLLVKPVVPAALVDVVLGALGHDTRKARRGRERRIEAGKRLKGRRILLAEDNEINQEIANAVLMEEGAEVRIVGDGVAAVAAVDSSADRPYDVVLMDLHMPNMDGHEATRRIRANPAHAGLPIIAMTASVMAEERERCLANGMNDHIPKPIDVANVMATLERWMKPLEHMEPEPEAPSAALAAAPAVKPPAAVGAVPLDLPGFDVPAALARINNNGELLRRLLLSFAKANATLAARVRGALEAGDIDVAFGLVHAVKGSAGNLGAVPLFKAAEAFQTALTKRETATFPAHLDAFGQRLDEVLATLGRLESPPPPPSAAAPPPPPPRELGGEERSRLLADCRRLVELMNKRSMGAIGLADEIKGRLSGGDFEADIRGLDSALTVLDFKAGLAVAEAMIGKLGEA
ncbi:MAG: response regulator [Alphaproteobacteria bacterium]|nr:response regulator [Alphaproteobacteria bacterium]